MFDRNNSILLSGFRMHNHMLDVPFKEEVKLAPWATARALAPVKSKLIITSLII